MVDEAPHNMAMVYQSHQADMYLEGNVAQTLRDLATPHADKATVEARRKELAAAHDAMIEKRDAQQAERARRHRSTRPGCAPH